ncbi:DUF6527 family protein [Sulfurimonas sp. HSL1-6]|uniref:DUF6527 family protein n=1 Tax=Thiomicrolovo immobilis TaxID=3131935 RepID=UPI0031F793F8
MLPCHPAGYPTHLQVQLRGSRADTGNWSWNGDTEKPTLKPSVLLGPVPWGPEMKIYRSHSFINDGMVKYLDDCSHDLKGQTVELLEVDDE